MRILHVIDLHLEVRLEDQLNRLWLGAHRLLEKEKPIDEANESTRLGLQLGGNPGAPDTQHAALALRVPSPTTGHRYGIRYKLAARKAGPVAHCLKFLDEVSKRMPGLAPGKRLG